MLIRAASDTDREAIWRILEPTIRAGETYALPRDLSRDAALRFWFSGGHEVFVAETDGEIAGTYFLRANPPRDGARVANCGYMTAPDRTARGIAGAMCEHSLRRARELGFAAMQFNFVVSTNERAVRLWQRLGFAIVETLPSAFAHPRLGDVDAVVMFRPLTDDREPSRA